MTLNYIKCGILRKSTSFNLKTSIQTIKDLRKILARIEKLRTFDINNMKNNSDGHAHRIIGNGVNNPPRNSKHSSRWYYRVSKVINYELGMVTYVIKPMPDSTNSSPAVQKLLNAYKGISVVMASCNISLG
jgi:hypothetical protein